MIRTKATGMMNHFQKYNIDDAVGLGISIIYQFVDMI